MHAEAVFNYLLSLQAEKTWLDQAGRVTMKNDEDGFQKDP